MAIKSAIFLLAFVLLATQLASSVDAAENEYHHHNHTKEPAYAPHKAPDHPPMKEPEHPPKAPRHPPFFQHPHFCGDKCEEHCKDTRPKRACMKTCTACCDKFKCVPDRSKQYCKNWDEVEIRGKPVKCP